MVSQCPKLSSLYRFQLFCESLFPFLSTLQCHSLCPVLRVMCVIVYEHCQGTFSVPAKNYVDLSHSFHGLHPLLLGVSLPWICSCTWSRWLMCARLCSVVPSLNGLATLDEWQGPGHGGIVGILMWDSMCMLLSAEHMLQVF